MCVTEMLNPKVMVLGGRTFEILMISIFQSVSIKEDPESLPFQPQENIEGCGGQHPSDQTCKQLDLELICLTSLFISHTIYDHFVIAAQTDSISQSSC